jgi:CubicO group peptidase (beta-lactamase class C family)
MGYILLGVIIESIAGCGLDEFSRENCFLPLGMEDTTFGPCGDVLHRTAATSNCPARKRTLVGEVHDGNAWAMGGVSGNAGLFSTAPDLAKFATMMLNGGLGALSPAAVRLAMASMLPPTIGGHTAGWFAYPNDMLPSGDLLSVEAIGHTGFTGTSAVIDPSCDLFVILLTNRVCSAADASEFSKTRRLFHNAVAQAMHSGR